MSFIPCFSEETPQADPQDQIQTVFTPYQDGLNSYKAFLKRARHSVYMAGFALGDKEIVDELIDLKQNKSVEVHILLDFSQTKGRSSNTESVLIESLRNVGIEVIAGNSEKSNQLMHDKYTIVDDSWVESGSWNYTKAANKQDNVLDFIKSPKRAKLFQGNWNKMYSVMRVQQAERDALTLRTQLLTVAVIISTSAFTCFIVFWLFRLRRKSDVIGKRPSDQK